VPKEPLWKGKNNTNTNTNTNTTKSKLKKVTKQNGKRSASTSSHSNSSSTSTTPTNTTTTTRLPGASAAEDGYEALTLEDIKGRIQGLCERVPRVPPEGLDANSETDMKEWATQLQAVIEEFNLLVCCISAATYKWQSERSGAADQNLSVLSAELANSQDQISSTVTPRLTNVLAPVVDLVVDKVITTQEEQGGTTSTTTEETKQNVYVRKQVDPSFLKLCATILSRNAPMIRQVVLCNFHKIDKCMTDYLQAQVKDGQHDSRGFAY